MFLIHTVGVVNTQVAIFDMLTTGHQLKAARAFAGDMTQSALAEAAGVHVNTIRKIEEKGASPITSAADVVGRIQRALETAGVEFLNHGQPGVRLAFRPRADPQPDGL